MVGGECVSVMWALGCVSMSASALCVSDLGMFVLLYSQVSVATCSLYVCVCCVSGILCDCICVGPCMSYVIHGAAFFLRCVECCIFGGAV